MQSDTLALRHVNCITMQVVCKCEAPLWILEGTVGYWELFCIDNILILFRKIASTFAFRVVGGKQPCAQVQCKILDKWACALIFYIFITPAAWKIFRVDWLWNPVGFMNFMLFLPAILIWHLWGIYLFNIFLAHSSTECAQGSFE